MPESKTPSNDVFHPPPELDPLTPEERHRRVHFYVATLGAESSLLLKRALLAIRTSSPNMRNPALQLAASKQFRESEFLLATKELICMWIHFEAVDQGGRKAPAWLMRYLKLSLYAADYLIADPSAMLVMDSHALCFNLKSLQLSASVSIARRLGFREFSQTLAPALAPLFTTTRSQRQGILYRSLTEEI